MKKRKSILVKSGLVNSDPNAKKQPEVIQVEKPIEEPAPPPAPAPLVQTVIEHCGNC